MGTLLKNLLTQDSSDMSKSPSFNDFSLCVGQEVESQLHDTGAAGSTDELRPERQSSGSPGQKKDVWQGVFNPGRNFNMGKVGRSYFDHVENPKDSPTTWEYIVKAEHLKQLSVDALNNGDGFLTADEVQFSLGQSAYPEGLIRQGDKNGSGKIDYNMFCDLLRKT